MSNNIPSMATVYQPTAVSELSSPWDDKTRLEKYCPIYVTTSNGAGRRFEVYITGPVLDVEHYVDLIDLLLTASSDDVFDIYIDSPGGLVASGGIISSAIAKTNATVNTIANGCCASAAALIHSSAKKENIKMGPFGMIMYHMSSHFDQGRSSKIASNASNQVKYVNKCLLAKAVHEGLLTEEDLTKLQGNHETYLNYEEFCKRMNRGPNE